MQCDQELPSVLIPYPGPASEGTSQDICVYLRPESNGVLVESLLLKVLKKNPEYKHRIFFIYLANIPGEFILQNHIVEKHYLTQMRFAVLGGMLFTDFMKKSFERYFHRSFVDSEVIGSFEALRRLGWTPDQLFNLYVPPEDYLVASGQSIKRFKDLFIVNYDIPALLQKNIRGTDIAVMVFRTSLSYEEFRSIFQEMERALREANVLSLGTPASRVFHYSKGPFEQILDGRDYLYASGGIPIPCEELSFALFLLKKDVPKEVIQGIIENPIVRYRDPGGRMHEDSIFLYTKGDSYLKAYEKFMNLTAQVYLPEVVNPR